MKVGILASTNGTDLPAIFDAKIENVEIACLITNNQNSGARKKAQKWGIKDFYISSKDKGRAEFDQEAIRILKEQGVEMVLLVGFMRIISPIFVREFKNAIFNVHPSLLPSFAGGMDNNVHEDVLAAGCKVSGATVHLVSEEVDEGAIVLQECVQISHNETVDSLKEKVQKKEQKMLINLIELFRDGKVVFEGGLAKILK